MLVVLLAEFFRCYLCVSCFLPVSLNGKMLASAFSSRCSAWSEKELDNILIELFYLSSLMYLSE